jgi:hypothetical protein
MHRNTMTIATWLLVIMGCARAETPSLEDEPQGPVECPDTSAVVVARIKTKLPVDERELRSYLWDTFAATPEARQFSDCPTTDWQERYWLHASALVRRAHSAGCAHRDLERCLKAIFLWGGTHLPVGAYEAKQGRRRVWIVVVKWEHASPGMEFRLAHTRVFALDARTTQQVGFVTCD